MRMFKMTRHNERSLTLVELLLVTSLMAALSLAVYQSLSNGLEVWKRSRHVSTEGDVLIFFDRLGMDLSRAMDFSLFRFEGADRSITIPTIVNAPLGRRGSREVEYVLQQPGLARYVFRHDRGEITRESAHYGRALKKEFGPPTSIVTNVTSVLISSFDLIDGRLVKHGAMDHDLPDYVRVVVGFKDDTGGAREFERMFEVPAAR